MFHEEKLLLLGLYLAKKGAFHSAKWLEDLYPLSEVKERYSSSLSSLIESAQKELERAQRKGIEILFYKDPKFPHELKQIPYPPLFIYIKGEIPSNPRFAIVGSRKPTAYGKEVASLFTKELSTHGFAIISGLARGIDTIAHITAIEAGGKTVAILGSGLDIIYPGENHNLASKIVTSGGAIISEFPLGTQPRRENFPRRNRLISGLSQGVLVVEAGERSGTLLTAKWAQEQGKDIFAIPGNIFSDQSKGTHLLIKEGAIPVTNPREIIEFYGFTKVHTQGHQSERITDEITHYLLEILSSYPMHLEEIIMMVGKSPVEVLRDLTQLEIEGRVKGLPGKFYIKT